MRTQREHIMQKLKAKQIQSRLLLHLIIAKAQVIDVIVSLCLFLEYFVKQGEKAKK